MPFENDAIHTAESVELNHLNFHVDMAARCGTLLEANNRGDGTRITENFRLVFHIRDENGVQMCQPSIELDPEDWLTYQRGAQTPDDLQQLLDVMKEYIARQQDLDVEEHGRLHAGFDENSKPVAGVPVYSRKRICTRHSCPYTHENDDQFHALQCRQLMEHNDVCEFCINPRLIVDEKDRYFVAYLRSEIVPEMMIAPHVASITSRMREHSNNDLAQSSRFWSFVQFFIRRQFMPFMMTFNFGAWETAVGRNHLRIRRECHGHLHLLFPLRMALDPESPLRNRFNEPERYRAKNIRAIHDAADRYVWLSAERRLNALDARFDTQDAQMKALKEEIEKQGAEINKNSEEIKKLSDKVDKMDKRFDILFAHLKIPAPPEEPSDPKETSQQ